MYIFIYFLMPVNFMNHLPLEPTLRKFVNGTGGSSLGPKVVDEADRLVNKWNLCPASEIPQVKHQIITRKLMEKQWTGLGKGPVFVCHCVIVYHYSIYIYVIIIIIYFCACICFIYNTCFFFVRLLLRATQLQTHKALVPFS